MKKYDIILFDLDGTLSDSSGGIIACLQYALNSLGIKEENMDILRSFVGPPLKEHFVEVYGLTDDKADIAVEKFREKYDPWGVYENELYPGIIDMLDLLKNSGKTICVATSKPENIAIKVLKYFKIYKYFDFVTGAQKDGPRTNKEQVMEELFKRAHITEDKKHKVVMIGDTNYDIIGANKMGVDSIGVNYGFGNKEEMLAEGAVTVVETVEELTSILLQ